MRVAVVGGGVVGLAVAWRLAAAGDQVTVYDPAPGSGATGVAAGMLAPVGESRFGEEPMHRLLLAGADRWPAFAAALTEATGHDLGYRDEGTLLVALTDDDLRTVARLADFHRRAGLTVEPLRAADLREREPLLAPRVRGGAFVAQDRQVDPRRLAVALRIAAEKAGAAFVGDPVTRLSDVDGADATVVAAGCGSAVLVPGLPVRPVKGQVLRLRATGDAPPLRHVLRGHAANRSVYVVPRRDGEIVVGATEEERGTDVQVTAGGVLDLLRPAVDLVPGLAEYALVETAAGSRPGTPDNAPIVGRLRAGVLVATGHYRDGVLLAPITADAVAAMVRGEAPPDEFRPFGPDRFPGVST
ncbi:glycine oxidase ThiO [Virgisporangium aliadipatigenens]|nr:glycine oxidase ThiO [Virgisporangium aliadipatigenens]